MKGCRLLSILAFVLMFTSCCRDTTEVWDDTKTAGRHMGRGISALGGKHGNSKAVYAPQDFYCADDGYYAYGEDFIPLPDADNCGNLAMRGFSPGDPGSCLPGIEAFQDPSTIRGMSAVFQNIMFNYKVNLVEGDENMETIHRVADYLRTHPHTYIFIEGHCDERGPSAYNLALGSQRANAVLQLLVAQGVNPKQLFTISYGKERPLIFEHHEEAFSKNRRVEFKIYQR